MTNDSEFEETDRKNPQSPEARGDDPERHAPGVDKEFRNVTGTENPVAENQYDGELNEQLGNLGEMPNIQPPSHADPSDPEAEPNGSPSNDRDLPDSTGSA